MIKGLKDQGTSIIVPNSGPKEIALQIFGANLAWVVHGRHGNSFFSDERHGDKVGRRRKGESCVRVTEMGMLATLRTRKLKGVKEGGHFT